MTREDAFKQYYESDFLLRVQLPEAYQFRHYRGKTANGYWKKIPFRIGNRLDLQKWVLKLGIIDLYYSTSWWLNPHKVASKGKGGSYVTADNLLLGNDLTFDIDAHQPINMKNLEEARQTTLKVYDYCIAKGKLFQYAAFTGYKGFRLVFKDPTDRIPNKAANRVEYISEKRKIFIAGLQEVLNARQLKMIDQQVTTNPLCVVRVIGSINSKSGLMSVMMSLDDLIKPVTVAIKDVPAVFTQEMTSGKGLKTLMTKEDGKPAKVGLPCPRPEYKGDDVSDVASLPHYFFTNKVVGTKCFIPIIKYPLRCSLSDKELRRLSRNNKLGDLYIFHDEEFKYVFSLKVMQFRACAKLLGKAYSLNAPQFKRRRKVLVPVHLTYERKLKGDSIKGTSRGHAMTLARTGGDSGLELVEIVQAVPGGL